MADNIRDYNRKMSTDGVIQNNDGTNAATRVNNAKPRWGNDLERDCQSYRPAGRIRPAKALRPVRVYVVEYKKNLYVLLYLRPFQKVHIWNRNEFDIHELDHL